MIEIFYIFHKSSGKEVPGTYHSCDAKSVGFLPLQHSYQNDKLEARMKKILIAILSVFFLIAMAAIGINAASAAEEKDTKIEDLKTKQYSSDISTPVSTPQIKNKAASLFEGWKVSGHVLFGANLSNERAAHDAEMYFDRGRLDLKKEGLSFFKEHDGGLRFTFETFYDADSKKPEFFLKYVYPWIKLTDNTTLQAGYIPTPLIGPEEMELRWLGEEIGKSLIDTHLKMSSRTLGAGLEYALPIGKIYVTAGEGSYNSGNAIEGIVELTPFKSSENFLKYFFAHVGGMYNMTAEEAKADNSTLWLARAGFQEKGVYSLSGMVLTTNGPSSRLAKEYPGLTKYFKNQDIENDGFELLGRVYPWKVIGADNASDMKKVWIMARHRNITGDFGYTQNAIMAGYDISNNLQIGIGTAISSASANTGIADNAKFIVAIQLKF